MNDQPGLFPQYSDIGVSNVFSRMRVLETEGRIDIHLAPREKEVAEHVAQGYGDKQIAFMMGICSKTVQSYCKKIFRKTDTHTKAAAIYVLVKRGIIE